MVESVDTPDLKSVGHCGRASSSLATPTHTQSHNIMDHLEYYLIIKDEHHPNKHIPVADHWDSQWIWWGPGAEAKAHRARKKLNRTLPAFHYCIVEAVMTA